MNAQAIIELGAFIATLAGGGAVGVARLTRIAVAVEQVVKSVEGVVSTVQGHETRISTLEGQQAKSQAPAG